MNNQLQNYARETLKDSLSKCNEGQQIMFKRMYANGNLDKNINDVVDNMSEDKLDWAMQQVERTCRNPFSSQGNSNSII